MRNKVLACVFSIFGIVVVLFGSIACYASDQVDYPCFPGFPEGPRRAGELGTGSQWIHNTPYGGITVDPDNSYAFLRMDRVEWTPGGRIRYLFSIINTNSSPINFKVVIPFDLGDYVFPKYVFDYSIVTDLDSYSVGLGSYTSASQAHRWITDPFNDATSSSGYYYSTGQFTVPTALTINFANVEPGTHHCYVLFNLFENYYYGESTTSDIDFWGLGRNTDLTSVNSALDSLFNPSGSTGVAGVFFYFGQIIANSTYLYLLLWVIVILNIVDIVLGWVNNL